MAINIFQGGKTSAARPNTASNSTRAQAAKDALATPAEASASGNTAVGTKGTLQKVGNTVGKIAGVAAKFLPGIGGTIASGLSNILNDPEWWQQIPGDALTTNQPLRMIRTGDRMAVRPAITEISHYSSVPEEWDSVETAAVLQPTDAMITQYLMPQIRKVVNAVPLQGASNYRVCLTANATLYALWRQLKKFRFMLGHGQTYMANMNDPAFPLFQTENSASLDAAINRIEEYLRANVRLPHTLCEYLSWRYGRVYKASDSAKASLMLYNVLPLSVSVEELNKLISICMKRTANSTAVQSAQADMYNAYFDHDLAVEIRDDTQYTYDRKEFALRTNCDLGAARVHSSENPNAVYLDSSLDNPTAFMASTVSTFGRDVTGTISRLVPAVVLKFYMPKSFESVTGGPISDYEYLSASGPAKPNLKVRWRPVVAGSDWIALLYTPDDAPAGDDDTLLSTINLVQAMKACELYNKDLLVSYSAYETDGNTRTGGFLADLTAPAFDLGVVSDLTIGQEHVYAFANLVCQERKHSMSYKQAEKLVTKEAANLVDNLDVAAVASPKVGSTT